MRLLLGLIVLCWIIRGQAFSAPAPPPPPGPRGIDFTPLVGSSDFTFTITLELEGRIVLRDIPYEIIGKASAVGLVELVIGSLPEANCERDGEGRLLIKEWKGGRKLLRMDIKAKDLPKDKQPKVYRPKKAR
jgi:hypothetical protein